MKNVQLLLNKEKQAKEAIVQAQNVLANIGQEKEELGIQILAEAKEKLDILEVGYLLNANIAERVMAPVRITRLDGRVLKLRARKQDVEKIAELEKQLKETQEYDEALAHIANQNIKINLDDGVKVNYAKFQNIEVSKEGKKSKKINLLKKL